MVPDPLGAHVYEAPLEGSALSEDGAARARASLGTSTLGREDFEALAGDAVLVEAATYSEE